MGKNTFNDDIDSVYDKIMKLDIMDVINDKEISMEEKENEKHKPKPKKKYDNNKWRRENPEKFKQVHKKNCEKYRKTHRKKMSEIEKKYYYKHREEILARAKERYKKKKELENK